MQDTRCDRRILEQVVCGQRAVGPGYLTRRSRSGLIQSGIVIKALKQGISKLLNWGIDAKKHI